MDPSVEPLSATMTSPRRLALPKAVTAFSTQNASELASLRQGITTETSSGMSVCWAGSKVSVENFGVALLFISQPESTSTRHLGTFCFVPLDVMKLRGGSDQPEDLAPKK